MFLLSSLLTKLKSRRGQAAVEYLLSTMALLVVFTTMYGFMQGQTKKLFTAAGVSILTAYKVAP